MLNSTVIAFIVVYVMEAVFIIIGNSFAIFVFLTERLHQKRTSFLLINLAVADLLVGISEPIVLASEKFDMMTSVKGGKKWEANPPSALQLLASSTSVFFLALIALERVYAVLWPLRHRVTKNRVYIYSIATVWVVGLCMTGLSLLWRFYNQVDKRYFIISIRMCLFISVLFICASYFTIHNRLSSTSPEIAAHRNQSIEHNQRLSRTLFIVIAASLVFWLPAFVVYTVQEFCLQFVSLPVYWLMNALHLANTMVNPFVYTFRMPIFKAALRKFRRKQRQNVEARQRTGFELWKFFQSSNRKHQPSQAHQRTDRNVEIQAVVDGGFQLESFQRE